MGNGKTITIFFVDSTPDGIFTANLPNLNGIYIKVPRTDIHDREYGELDMAGVYFLLCTDTEDGQDSVYFGEAENLRKRINQHLLDYRSGRDVFYWQNVIVFTGSELNKTLIRYMEYHLTVRARNARRYRVLTKNTCSSSVIKRHEKAAMEEFMKNIDTILSALNYRILEPLPISNDTISDSQLLSMSVGNFHGSGYLTNDYNFLLQKGSVISPDESVPCSKNVSKCREAMLESGKIENWVTKEDILWSSSSCAAAFVYVRPINGPRCWKNQEGISFGELSANRVTYWGILYLYSLSYVYIVFLIGLLFDLISIYMMV